MVAPALGLRDNVIHGHVAEWEHDAAASADALLAAIERVPVRLVVWKVALVRAARDVRAVVDIIE